MLSGETKQMIANVRSEFRRLIKNRVDAPGEDPEFFINDLTERIEKFEQYLVSIDVQIPHQVPPLGVSANDSSPVVDRFGG